MDTQDFLLELGTEELPPKQLKQLYTCLVFNFSEQLLKFNLSCVNIEGFATPRRLAILVTSLQLRQKDKLVSSKGPFVDAPLKAVHGFAKSCGVDKSELAQKVFAKTNYYYFEKIQKGMRAIDLLEEIADTAIKKITTTKSMRWSDLDFNFVRPVHWLVMLLGTKVVPAKIMGLKSGRISRGLRFIGKEKLAISNAKDYQKIMLDKTQIEVNFAVRKQIIHKQIVKIANNANATAVIDEALLDEVCALVECPLAFLGVFDKSFLSMPKEVLISVMKVQQKYFYLLATNGKLLPLFIAVANTKSIKLSAIISGNERVILARLTDAKFFLEQDKKESLEAKLPQLDNVLFMQSLGSMGDKVKRMQKLICYIASIIDVDAKKAMRAGLLSKSDLVSNMVAEFANLQGVMGGCYALYDGESEAVAVAIKEHYYPRFAKDMIPSTKEGLVVAIADKLDTITGVYGISQGSIGSKDPYALRRAALGLLRIMIEGRLNINLKELINISIGLYASNVNVSRADSIFQFIMSRMQVYYKEQGISSQAFNAVSVVSPQSPYDFYLRITALNSFMLTDKSRGLIEANKRIVNILKNHNLGTDVDATTFVEDAEKALYKSVNAVANKVLGLTDYVVVMNELTNLKDDIALFFDKVMVNTTDKTLRHSRLTLLNWIRSLFLLVADISKLA